MGATVTAFNAITGRDLSEAEGWLLLQTLKDVRQWQNPSKYHHDSALDGVAYSALKAEALSEEQAQEPSHVISDIPSWEYWEDGDIVEVSGNAGSYITLKEGQHLVVSGATDSGVYLEDGRYLFLEEEISTDLKFVSRPTSTTK